MTSRISRRYFLGLTLPACFGSCSPKQAPPAPPVIERFRHFEIGGNFSKLQLHWKREDGSLLGTLAALHDHLLATGQNPICLMNAGIFNPTREPLGWHVEGGRELRPLNQDSGEGNFFLMPNGVFSISSDQLSASIRPTQESQEIHPSLATQSGPLLLHRGAIHPAFKAESPNKNIRNGVGIREDGSMVLAISTTPVCFYDFATYFKETQHCMDALYLDGTISQCWLKSKGKPPPSDQQFAGMLAVVA